MWHRQDCICTSAVNFTKKFFFFSDREKQPQNRKTRLEPEKNHIPHNVLKGTVIIFPSSRSTRIHRDSALLLFMLCER